MKNKKIITGLCLIPLSLIASSKDKVSAEIVSQSPRVGTSTGRIVIKPGNLSLSSVQGNIDFGTITLTDKTQMLSKEGTMGVSDYTDTFAGWTVRVAKQNVKWDNKMRLSINTKENILNQETKPFWIQTAQKYELKQLKDYQAILTVPPDVKPDNYSTKILWNLVQGPENN